MTYFVKPDPNGPYTGATEQQALTHLHRRMCAALGYPKGFTNEIAQVWKNGSNVLYFRMPDAYYTALNTAGAFTSYETTNATTSSTGMSQTSTRPDFVIRGQFDQVIVGIGDSIYNGGNASLASAARMHSLAIASTNAVYTDDVSYNNVSWQRQSLNLAIDSSRFVHSTDSTKDWSTIYEWKVGDMRFSSTQTPIFVVQLGSNDITYETDSSGLWTRAQSFLTNLRTAQPTATIIACTLIARTTGASLNADIEAYNDLLRAGYASYADALCDFGALTDFDPNTPSVTTNATYYGGDGVHPIAAGTALMGAELKAVIDGL